MGAFATPPGGSDDHGAFTGLGDDDHSQYLRTDGTRGLSGPWTPGDGIDMAGGSFRVPGGEILPANLDARGLAAEVDGSGSLVNLYVGVDAANPRKRVLLTGDTPDEPVVHVYTASTTWTKPAAATFSHIVVECVGGGGGGGGPSATGTNQASQSGGGGGGGYTRNLFGASVLAGSTYTVTVGAGGNGRGGGNTGYDGTSSSFSGPGITSAPVAGGGSGMNAGASYSSTGGGGAGSASNGDISVPGMAGGNGVRISLPGVTTAVAAGNAWGGGSVHGTPQRQSNVGSAGYNGADYGVGGSGAGINQGSSTVAGGGVGAEVGQMRDGQGCVAPPSGFGAQSPRWACVSPHPSLMPTAAEMRPWGDDDPGEFLDAPVVNDSPSAGHRRRSIVVVGVRDWVDLHGIER